MAKKETESIVKNIKDKIIEYLEKNPKSKRESIFKNLSADVTKTIQNITKKKLNKNAARSYIGTVLSNMAVQKIIENNEGLLSLTGSKVVSVKKSTCYEQTLILLKSKAYTKNDLFNAVIKKIGADKTKSQNDDNQVKSYVGMILEELLRDSKIELKDSKYSYKIQTKDYSDCYKEAEFKKLFFKRLYTLGGSYFESFLSNLIEKYFVITGRAIIDNKVLGGPDDNGIDIVIDVSDDLGFIEKIMIQSKNREKTKITENEVRNFYGALNAQKGTRGIYATTTGFTPTAVKMLDSLDNLVGLDGEKLFEIARKVQYGIRETQKGFSFDEVVFSE